MLTKILIRKDSFIEHYQHWLQKNVKDILEMLSGSYANEAFGKGSEDLKCINNTELKGIIWQPTPLNQNDLAFLIDLFKTKLIAFAGYEILLSDESIEILDNGLKYTVHRHVLKQEKKKNISNIKKSQFFGPVTLEHKFNKDKNIFYLSAGIYSNSEVNAFEKLMEFLLS